MKRAILVTLVLCLAAGTSSSYTIRGRLGNTQSCYYPRVYLEVIREVGGFNGTNANNLITSVDVSPDGSFLLQGEDLPAEKMYYRLYASSSASVKSVIKMGTVPNYLLLLLDNSTDETLVCDDFCSGSATYSATTADNQLLAEISSMQHNYLVGLSGDISASKKEFLEDAYKKQMFRIADTSSSMVMFYALDQAQASGGILAIAAEKAKTLFPGSAYTRQVAAKVTLESLPTSVAGSMRFNFILLALLVVSLLANLFLFFRRKKMQENDLSLEQQARDLIESLSIKEREILKLVHEGLSNKEIADKYNIEVSTVKTHVSRIYQKIGVRNRKEVASIARYV